MLAYAFSALLLALSVTAIKIDTPAVNQCKDATFTITESHGAVHLAVVPLLNPCSSDALLELGPITITDNKFTLKNANVPAGTKLYVVVDDESGAEAWTQAITVGGSASDCPATTPAAASPSSSANRSSQTSAPVNAANSPNNSIGTSAASTGASVASGAVTLMALLAAAALF